MKECIRNFDMTICEKANKSAMLAFETKIYEEFVQNYDYI